MNIILRSFGVFKPFLKRLGLCGTTGWIVGSLVGILLALLDLVEGGMVISSEEAIYVSLILSIFSWIVIVFFLYVFGGYTLRSIALPTLINCLLTTFALVFIARSLDLFKYAPVLGLALGALIGFLLCQINFNFISNQEE
ncbi:MAG: hypothetical protein AAGG51_10265 [Cyanobacteria bacterium P01_G01_bin.54]